MLYRKVNIIEIDLFIHQFLKFFSVSGSNLQNAFKQKLVWRLNATLQLRDDDHHKGYKKVSDGHQHVVVALFVCCDYTMVGWQLFGDIN